MANKSPALLWLWLSSLSSIFFLPVVLADCECTKDEVNGDKKAALKLKIVAIATILFSGAVGILLPVLGKRWPALRPERDAFFVVKAFAAGVILATGMIHVLPDAFDSLTSPCLAENPWQNFPFAGFVAMMSALVTLMIDTCATSYYTRVHFGKARPVAAGEKDEEAAGDEHDGHVHLHTHATHGHAHGAAPWPMPEDQSVADHIRHRVVSQARFKAMSTFVMALFFSLTTPVGVAVGIAVTSQYDENSTTALTVEGLLDAASAGILIYMALVDLLAADFMSTRMQSKGRLQLGAYVALLLGAGFMSLLAKWA